MKKLLKALFAPFMGALLLCSSVFAYALGGGGTVGESTGGNQSGGTTTTVSCAAGEREADPVERQSFPASTATMCIGSNGDRISRFPDGTSVNHDL
jgi:hypothetical protein